MKKLLFILAISLSFTTVKAQADPAFTAKFKSVVDASKAYKQANNQDKPAKMQLIIDAMADFYPITDAEWSSKFNAMVNSPTEFQKLGTIIDFVQCAGNAISTFQQCLQVYGDESHGRPQPIPQQCITMGVNAMAACITYYL